MDLDILKVVNEYLEKKDSSNKENLNDDKVQNLNSINIDKQGFFSTKELESIIYELFTNNGNVQLLSEKYLIDQELIIKLLQEKGYQKIWANKEITFFPNTNENLKILEIISELNSGKSLDIASNESGIGKVTLLETLKNKGFIPYWVRVSKKYEFNIICEFGEMSILRNAKTGIFKYIIFNKNLTLTIKQTNLLLGINSFYYFSMNESKNRFVERIHFYRLSKVQVQHLITADPALSFLRHSPYLFTLKGIKLLMEVSGKDKNYNKEYVSFLNKQGFLLDSIGLNESTNKSKLNDIVNELNNGKTIEEISIKLNINKENLQKELEMSNYKYENRFELWTQYNRDNFIEEILHQLNSGLSIYDIASKYINDRNRRLKLSTSIQNTLEASGYIFNKENRKWEESTKTYDVQYFVSSLNNGVLFNELESITGLNRTQIRMKLKREGIYLDYKTHKWIRKGEVPDSSSNEKESPLEKNIDPNDIKQLVASLNKGVSFSEIKSITGLTRQEINKKFKNEGVYFNFDTSLWMQKEKLKKANPISPDPKIETLKDKDQNLNEPSFNEEEIRILKDLIKDFATRKLNNNNEFKVIIKDEVYNELNYFTEVLETSKSLLIEKALKDFFKAQKQK